MAFHHHVFFLLTTLTAVLKWTDGYISYQNVILFYGTQLPVTDLEAQINEDI